MIYLGAGDTPLRLSIHLSRGLFKFILFKYQHEVLFVGIIQSKLWEKGTKGMGGSYNNALFFLEERGNILHTLGLKVHKFMGSQHS